MKHPDPVAEADAYYEAKDIEQTAIDLIRDDLRQNPFELVEAMSQLDADENLTDILTVLGGKETPLEKWAAIDDIFEKCIERHMINKKII